MVQNPIPHGVVVPMSTPFTASGTIDEAAAERMSARLAEHDIGVFVLGTTGETASIPATERLKLVAATVRGAAKRVPVYAGIGDNCVQHSLDAATAYFQHGIAAVVAHLPGYYALNADEIQAYFELLAANIVGPMMIYNIPPATRMSIPLDVVEKLSTQPSVVGFKDSENVPGRAEELARRFNGRTDFALFMGVAIHSLKALKLGFNGLVPSSGNLAPSLWHELYESARAGDWNRAEALQHRLDSIAQIFQKNRSLGQSLAALKACLESIGLCGPTVLPPLQTLSAPERENLHHQLAAVSLS